MATGPTLPQITGGEATQRVAGPEGQTAVQRLPASLQRAGEKLMDQMDGHRMKHPKLKACKVCATSNTGNSRAKCPISIQRSAASANAVNSKRRGLKRGSNRCIARNNPTSAATPKPHSKPIDSRE